MMLTRAAKRKTKMKVMVFILSIRPRGFQGRVWFEKYYVVIVDRRSVVKY